MNPAATTGSLVSVARRQPPLKQPNLPELEDGLDKIEKKL